MVISEIKPAIPRAIYYMSPKVPIKSLTKILFSRPSYNKVEEFEKKFAEKVDCQYGLSTSHARIALYFTLKALELPPDSEVLLTGINLPDMVNMINLNNLRPVCIDYSEAGFDISIEDIEKKINSKTKVIFLTILAGIIPNIQQIYELAKKHNLIVIQDLTQAFYLKDKDKDKDKDKEKDIASYADVSIYSLCDLKDIHTHRGGMIVTNNQSLYGKIEIIRNKESINPSLKYFIQFILEDFLSSIILRRKFFDFLIYPLLIFLYRINKLDAVVDLTKGKGFKIGSVNIGRGLWGGDGDLIRNNIPGKLKYRYTDMQADIGFRELDEVVSRIEKRKKLAIRLAKKLNPGLLPFTTEKDHSYWKFPIKTNDVKKYQKILLNNGIDSAPTNLPNLSLLDCFKNILQNDITNTKFLTDNILYIPAHYYLSEKEVDAMADIINSI